MKWKSTLGLMGTSENFTPLNSAPIYSVKRLVASDGYRRERKRKRAMKAIGGLENIWVFVSVREKI